MRNDRVKADEPHSALLVVDVQPDFLPGGALGVKHGDEILEPVQRLLDAGQHELVVATQDWHPRDHISFAGNHPGRVPMETIDLYGHEQTLWPDHCVQGSAGAELARALDWRRVSAIIRKGVMPDCDSYSGIRNNWNARGERPPTGLAGYLRERGIEHLYICGLTREFCAKWTAEDAVDEGFRVSLFWALTRPVDPASDERVRRELTHKGVEIVHGVP